MATSKDGERPPLAHIEVVAATPDQEPILANLLELYSYDFTEFQDLVLGQDGRFGYTHLPLYWLEAHRYPFLVQLESRLAGFALVKRGSEISGDETVWDMAEFFVVRGCRRLGIGTEIAQQVWRRFPGRWEVRVMESNQAAFHFWQHAIAQFVGNTAGPICVVRGEKNWFLFSFESRPEIVAGQSDSCA